VRITFDAPTNSLLVVSSFKDFQALRKVIERLDAPRKQVFIEALILEVSLDKTRETGVAYHGGGGVHVPATTRTRASSSGGFEASKTLNPTSLVSNLGGLTGALVRAHHPRPAGADLRHRRAAALVRRVPAALADQQRRQRAVQPQPAHHQQPGGRDLRR
jgi:hypothetical protein